MYINDLADIRNLMDKHFGLEKSDKIMAIIDMAIAKGVKERSEIIEKEWEDEVADAEYQRDNAECEAEELREQIEELESQIEDLEEEIKNLKK